MIMWSDLTEHLENGIADLLRSEIVRGEVSLPHEIKPRQPLR